VCPRAGVRTYLANYCIDDEASLYEKCRKKI
jgi:hypothetical protein